MQFTSFTINDGAATPVAVTYGPELLSSSQTVLVDRRQATRDLQPTITATFDRATPNRRTFKVARSYAIPISSVVNGLTVVNDSIRAKVEYIIPLNAALQHKKDIHAMVVNGENHVLNKTAVVDLDPPY